jgi:hypothetical protein
MFHANKLLIIHTWIKLGSELLANNKFLCNAPSSVDEEIHGSVPPWRFASFQTVRRIRNPVTDQHVYHMDHYEKLAVYSRPLQASATQQRHEEPGILALPPQALSDLAITQTLKSQRITLPLIPLPQRRTMGLIN